MANVWAVKPEEKKIELVWDDGNTKREFWISVKQRLTVGENRNMLKSISTVSTKIAARGQKSEGGAEANFEWTEYSFARCSAYLLDWSLTDESNNKLPLDRPTLESFNQEVFDLIDNAIDKHEQDVNEAHEKKTNSGGRKRKAT
jgi:hypothetical protein